MNETSPYASRAAVASLVLGILGLVGSIGFPPVLILAVAAWVIGWRELRAIRNGNSSPAGRGLAQAGTILGCIGTGLAVVVLCVTAGFVYLGNKYIVPQIQELSAGDTTPAANGPSAPKQHKKHRSATSVSPQR